MAGSPVSHLFSLFPSHQHSALFANIGWVPQTRDLKEERIL